MDEGSARNVIAGETRSSGRMSGRGYGQPLSHPGAGVEMLSTYVRAAASRYPAYRAHLDEIAGHLDGVASVRRGYDEKRRDLRREWRPYGPPIAKLSELYEAKEWARKQVESRATSAKDAVAKWRAAAEAKATSYRPKLSEADLADARARLAAFNPGAWKSDEVPARRAQIIKGAIDSGDLGLADEALFGRLMDWVASIAKAPTSSFARPKNPDANRSATALWNPERWELIKDLVGTDGAEAVAAWRTVEAEAGELGDLIDHERGRMLDSDPWPD
jgi:hypothetical protein